MFNLGLFLLTMPLWFFFFVTYEIITEKGIIAQTEEEFVEKFIAKRLDIKLTSMAITTMFYTGIVLMVVSYF